MALTLFHTLAPTSGTISPKTSGTLLLSLPSKANSRCYSLFLQKQTQDIDLLRIFQLSNIVHHPYQSVQCVCVLGGVGWGGVGWGGVGWGGVVCIFCIVTLEPLSTLCVSFFLFFLFSYKYAFLLLITFPSHCTSCVLCYACSAL